MAEESDGVEEALDSSVRLAVMAGARLGSELVRAREEGLRQQQLRSELSARQLTERLEAEKRFAVAELSQVYRPDWWDRADAQQIGQTYATARAWAPEADEAGRAENRMRDELQARYGIDLDHAEPRAVTAEIEAWQQRLEQQRREEAGRQRSSGAGEEAEAAVLADQAAWEDRRAEVDRDDERRSEAQGNRTGSDVQPNPWLPGTEHRDARDLLEYAEEERRRAQGSETRANRAGTASDLQYDSAERRTADARALEDQGVDHDVAATRMQADTGAGTPAALATEGAGQRSRAPKARKSAGRGAQIERAGVER